MIADTDTPAQQTLGLPPLITPGHTFRQNGRVMMVLEGEGGEVAYAEAIKYIPTELIDPHPKNRTWCDPVALAELVASIREHGQSTPGILRPHPTEPGRYQLVAAWRRWLACKELQRPLAAVVRELDDVQALEQLYLENAQREGLRPLDEADLVDGMLELRDAEGRRVFTLERVALARYGTASAGDVARVAKVHKLRLLPEILREPVNDGILPLRVAFLVARIADPQDREKAAGEVLKDPYAYGEDRPMTVRRATEHIAKNYQVSLKGWQHVDRPDLLTEDQKLAMGFAGSLGEPGDGTCLRCPYLAKNSPLFHDSLASGSKKGSGESGVDPMTCTRASCHRSKLENLWRIDAAEFAKANGVPPENLVSLEESEARRWRFVRLENKPGGPELGNWDKAQDPKLPTWEKILKGSGAELKVAADQNGKPVLVCEPEVAITVGKSKLPDLFAHARLPSEKSLTKGDLKDLIAKRKKGELTEAERVMLERLEAQEEKERLQKLKDEMDRAVEAETKADCLRELLDKLTEKGPGLAGAHAMVLASCREHGIDFLAWLTGEPEEELAKQYDSYDIEGGLEKHLKGRTVNELIAIAAVASVYDDVHFSGTDRASDFQAMCKAVKLDTKEVYERVKKAHKLAFKDREKARRESLNADGKKRPKNSSQPEDWTVEHEACKTAAADARAGDDRVVLLEYSAETEETAMIEALLKHEIPVTPPNEYGIFTKRAVFTYEPADCVGFALDLARTSDGQWAAGFDYRIGEKDGYHGNLPADDALFATRAHALLGALNALYVDWTDATPAKRLLASHEAVRAMLSRIIAQVEAVDPSVPGAEHNEKSGSDEEFGSVAAHVAAEANIDYDQVDVEAAALAVKADRAAMAGFIGVKPKRDEPERLKRWDALRNKILRKAGLK